MKSKLCWFVFFCEWCCGVVCMVVCVGVWVCRWVCVCVCVCVCALLFACERAGVGECGAVGASVRF